MLGFILACSLLLSLIKLIYAGRVPAIIHKPLPRACVRARVCIRALLEHLDVCVCVRAHVRKGAVLGVEVTPELDCQVFQGGYEAVQLYETSAYVE